MVQRIRSLEFSEEFPLSLAQLDTTGVEGDNDRAIIICIITHREVRLINRLAGDLFVSPTTTINNSADFLRLARRAKEEELLLWVAEQLSAGRKQQAN